MTTLSDKTVITRKPCVCYGCARTMPKRSKIRKIVVVEDGQFMHSNWCITCDQYYDDYGLTEDDQFNQGELKENDPEGWEEIRQEVEKP